MDASKGAPWSNQEVDAFLSSLADEQIQKELDGATQNKNIFKAQMLQHGFCRTSQQCQKSDYRALKDHNGGSGARRKNWKWYEKMDAIYCVGTDWPATVGRAAWILQQHSLKLRRTVSEFPAISVSFALYFMGNF